MATFFGEVLPVTNRAYNDAEDDEEATQECSNPFTVTCLCEEKALSASVLIVACGQFAAAYVDCLLPPAAEPLVTVDWSRASDGDDGDDGPMTGRHRPPPPARLYRLSADTCVARCVGSVTPEQHYWLADSILSQFEGSPTAVVLSSAPMSEYLSNSATYEESPSLLVRCLATREYQLPDTLVRLEPPNVVKGVAAAVLTQCSLSGCAACLLHLYTSALRPDAETAAALHAATAALVPALSALQPRRPRPPADTPDIYM